MGSTTTEGKGNGAADIGVKGPGNNRNYYVSKEGPHVVSCGIVTLPTVNVGPGHSLTGDSHAELYVTLPEPLPESPQNYVVMLTPLGQHGGYGQANINVYCYAKWGTTTFPVFHLNADGGAAEGMSDVAGRMVQYTIIRIGQEIYN